MVGVQTADNIEVSLSSDLRPRDFRTELEPGAVEVLDLVTQRSGDQTIRWTGRRSGDKIIIPISVTQDTAGPMARTVTDAAILLTAPDRLEELGPRPVAEPAEEPVGAPVDMVDRQRLFATLDQNDASPRSCRVTSEVASFPAGAPPSRRLSWISSMRGAAYHRARRPDAGRQPSG